MKIISSGVRDLIRNICEEAKIKGKRADINFLVELHLVKEKVEVIYNGVKIDTLPVLAFKNLFARRNKFYAVAKDNMLGEIEVVRYANLHQHTCYSILDGMGKIPDIVQKTEWASAITDHGVMYGMVQFHKEMKSHGKKPIIGFEAYTESIDGQKEKNHLVLLARNNKGLKNLIKLTSLGFTNFYKKPQLSYDMLRHHNEGVIATSACLGGEIPRALINGNEDLAYKIANELIAIFGKENFFIEIQRHNIAVEKKLNEQLLEMAKKLGVKAIATADSHYVEKEDAYIHEIQLCMQTKKKMNDPTRWRFPGEGYHVHTSEEMEELFNDLPELLDNTLDLVESIDCELELGNVYMPSFPVPEGFKDEEEYFIQLCWEGFDKRFKGTKKDNKEYRERLEFEIGVINKMGFPGYFVIVWDFIRFAKERKILVGPGRGSACGSLVAYCLEITNLDPIKYGLLFERFLNVDRVSMPDIDIDFTDFRREEVINYVREKYGVNAVSRIITFGTLAPRAVIRAVTKVMDKPYSLGDVIAKSIPEEPKMTLKKALDQSQEFANMYENDQEIKEIVDISFRLEGIPRNISQHACGTIISPSAVTDYIPQVLIKNKDTGIIEATTQLIMTECEEMGLLKMDFLGLRTMGVFDRALNYINKKRVFNGEAPITFDDIPLTDVNVYDFISKGQTAGVFQLESPGMTSFMKELFQDAHKYIGVLSKEALYKKGEELFERLVAGISLYRPGPIDEIPNYINFMLNPDQISYEVPELKPILDNTYSVIVYQEQCMFIVRELAGFSKGMADTVRKAMSKKKEEMLEDLGKKFIYGQEDNEGNVVIEGCIRKGIAKEIAKGLWSKMTKFGKYAFNKSHAAGYAVIAVRTGWLAYYYPTEYMCANLNSFISKSDKIKAYMSVCKKKDIEVLAPDVNKSREFFMVEGEAIRFGLMGIKNMGKISLAIIEERDTRGEFGGFQDFAERMAKFHKVDKKVLEALVYSGAVDSFEGTRRAKLFVLDKILAMASQEKKNYNSGQMTIFDIGETFLPKADSFREELKAFKYVKIPEKEEFEKRFKLEKEKEYAGFYVSEHPLDEYNEFINQDGVHEISFLTPEEETFEEEANAQTIDGQEVRIVGILKDIKTYYTKRGNKPLNVFTIEDRTGEIECVAFSNVKAQNEEFIIEGKIVSLDGRIKQDEKGVQIIVKRIIDIDQVGLDNPPKAIVLTGSMNRIQARVQYKRVQNFLNKKEGTIPVVFIFNGKKFEMKEKANFDLNTIITLQGIVGQNNCNQVFK